jgi:outer membrane lipoprotein SlyB
MKIKTLALLFLPAFCLASCGGDDGASSSKSPTYHVETSVTSIGNNQVYFGSAFNDEQFEIEDQNSVKVSAVTAAMVTGFDSKQISFGKGFNRDRGLSRLIAALNLSDPFRLLRR